MDDATVGLVAMVSRGRVAQPRLGRPTWNVIGSFTAGGSAKSLAWRAGPALPPAVIGQAIVRFATRWEAPVDVQQFGHCVRERRSDNGQHPALGFCSRCFSDARELRYLFIRCSILSASSFRLFFFLLLPSYPPAPRGHYCGFSSHLII